MNLLILPHKVHKFDYNYKKKSENSSQFDCKYTKN
jgi:hypothetical protein